MLIIPLIKYLFLADIYEQRMYHLFMIWFLTDFIIFDLFYLEYYQKIVYYIFKGLLKMIK